MFALPALLIAGGLAYTSSITYKRFRDYRQRLSAIRSQPSIQRMSKPNGEAEITRTVTQADRSLTLASLSLSLTITGIIFKSLLIMVCVPTALFIFAPTLRDAWRTLRQDRRITPPVLDATRVMLCIVMGYHFALALDTWLRTLTQRMMLRTDIDFQEALTRSFPEAPATVWRYSAGADVATPVAELAVGDILHFEAGELIPVDGIVRNGLAWIDECFITGKLKQCAKQSAIASGPLLLSGMGISM
ncbi:MAG: hypothetical protein R2911_26365 [Caldilineaceae bacterium]